MKIEQMPHISPALTLEIGENIYLLRHLQSVTQAHNQNMEEIEAKINTLNNFVPHALSQIGEKLKKLKKLKKNNRKSEKEYATDDLFTKGDIERILEWGEIAEKESFIDDDDDLPLIAKLKRLLDKMEDK